MHVNQPHYLPLPIPFFSILVGVFFLLVLLLQVGALRYAYMRIGLSAGGAMLVLVGGYFNWERQWSPSGAQERSMGSFLTGVLAVLIASL